MYCKYCGNRIASDTTKCVSCGANIDLNDGGQSFFDDNELSAWQSDSISYNAQTSMPKTEMIEPLPPQKNNFSEEYEKTISLPQTSVDTSTSRHRTRSKNKKNILDYLNLSSSNKLIIFCIASALVIVLLAVAIIAVLNSGNDEANTDTAQTNYTASVNDENEAESDTNTDVANGEGSDDNDSGKDKDNSRTKDNDEEKPDSKDEIKGLTIMINNRKIEYPVSAYIIKDKIYISIDIILKAEGYKAGIKTEYDENRVRYDHRKTSKAIEIEKGTNKIWIRENDESVETQYLEGNSFNVGSDTYVAAKSFLNKLGYSKVDYNKDKTTLTVNK